MMYRITIDGPIPGKKGHRGAFGSRIFTRPAVAQRLKELEAAVFLEWFDCRTSPAPLECVDVEVHFTVKNLKSDLDGKLTTLLDVLKNVGVIVDDNSKRVVGFQVTRTLDRGCEERADITLLERVLES